MGNFSFFSQNPKGKDSTETGSLSELTFALKVSMIEELQAMEYQTPELMNFRAALVDEIVAAVSALNRLQFQVRQNLAYVEKFASPDAFQCLDIVSSEELAAHIAPLIPPVNEDESAKRLDVVMYRMMLFKARHDEKSYERYSKTIRKIAVKLEQKAAIPAVLAARDTIAAIKGGEFWKNAGIPKIDAIRGEIRNLMQYLHKEMKTKVIDFTDKVVFEREGERLKPDSALDDYYERAFRYVHENENHPVLVKLKNNLPLDNSDMADLEKIFWHEIGSHEEYQNMLPQEEKDTPLGKFVRSLTGLSREAAQKAFSAFLDESVYTKEQIGLVKNIMEWMISNGTMDRKELRNTDNLGGIAITEVFDAVGVKHILSVIDAINANAMLAAA